MENESHPRHWCIVGGGIIGLTLAKRLAETGQRVTLLEAAPEIGGLASAWSLGDFTWDRHYHVTLLSDRLTRQMLRDLDLEAEMKWVETKTGFFTAGKLYSLSNSWEFLNFPPLKLLEKLRLGFNIFLASKIRNWRPLEEILVSDWLRKWSGEGTFRKLWLPLLKAKLGPAYQKVSAVFIWATIARMYRARQTGLKKEMFGYLPGGYARIFREYANLLSKLGVALQCSSPVDKVTQLEEGGVRIELVSGESIHCDRAVLTIPSPILAKVVPQLTPEERQAHEQIEYLGILCASVVLKKSLSPYYVTNITEGWVPFTAVIEMTALIDPQECAGSHLVYLPRYADMEDPAWKWSEAQLEEAFLSALEKMAPHFQREDLVVFRVSRVKHVLALPTLRYSERLPRIPTSSPDVFCVNSAQILKGTLNVNEVIEVAEAAFREVFLPLIEDISPNQSLQELHGETSGELVTRS